MLVKNYSETKCKVTFIVDQNDFTGKEEIKVLGDFNAWNPAKATKLKFSKGKFSGDIELFGGNTYEFRYLANNAIWFNDDACDGYTSSPYSGIENSVLNINTIEPKVSATKAKATPVKKDAVAKSTTAVKKEIAPKVKVASAPKKETVAKAAPVAKKEAAPKKVSTAPKAKATSVKSTAKKA